MDTDKPMSDAEMGLQKYQDELRAQGAQYDMMVRDLEAMGDAPGNGAKICKEGAHWLKRLRPSFTLRPPE